ncbi:MAG: hypothetical protein ACI82F_000978 [Planctomycetota bacterium]|jgi:uncharacterized protein YciI
MRAAANQKTLERHIAQVRLCQTTGNLFAAGKTPRAVKQPPVSSPSGDEPETPGQNAPMTKSWTLVRAKGVKPPTRRLWE